MLCKIYKKGEKIKIFSEEMIWNLLHLTTKKKQNIKMKTKTKYKNKIMSKIITSTTGGISEINYKTSTTGGLRIVNYKLRPQEA